MELLRVKSPYSVLTAGVSGRAQPLGADLAMREHDGTILLVECKYSSDVSYVTRNGYLQALTYLAEANHALRSAAASCIVAPASVVVGSHQVQLPMGSVGLMDPEGLAGQVEEHLATDSSLDPFPL